jgi:hypothetical protein
VGCGGKTAWADTDIVLKKSNRSKRAHITLVTWHKVGYNLRREELVGGWERVLLVRGKKVEDIQDDAI